MKLINVDIGHYVISNDPDVEIKTYALGSCVSLAIYDKHQKIAGLNHIALPESKTDPKRSEQKPGYFADTGMPLFLELFYKNGSKKSDLVIKLFGGASIMDPNGFFDIGRRNVLEVKKLLWKEGLGPISEEVGGSVSRTVSIKPVNGEVIVSGKEGVRTF